MADDFSSAVLEILRRAGWHEGRNVTAIVPPPQFSLFPCAQDVLAEFGGLHIGECGAGVDCATSDVNLDPHLATHLTTELKEFESSLNTREDVKGVRNRYVAFSAGRGPESRFQRQPWDRSVGPRLISNQRHAERAARRPDDRLRSRGPADVSLGQRGRHGRLRQRVHL
jgi:hypothetical protein